MKSFEELGLTERWQTLIRSEYATTDGWENLDWTTCMRHHQLLSAARFELYRHTILFKHVRFSAILVQNAFESCRSHRLFHRGTIVL